MAICFISHTFPKNVNNRTWRSLATISGAAYHTAGLTIKMKGSLQGAPFPIGWHATLLLPGGNSQLCSQYVCVSWIFNLWTSKSFTSMPSCTWFFKPNMRPGHTSCNLWIMWGLNCYGRRILHIQFLKLQYNTTKFSEIQTDSERQGWLAHNLNEPAFLLRPRNTEAI